MSDFFSWYDGDTSYNPRRNGLRVAGVNTPEKGVAGADEARDAALLATTNGYRPTATITQDPYGRDVAQLADRDGNTLGQALVSSGLGAPMGGDFAHGVSPTARASRELMGLQPQGIEQNAAFAYLAEQARRERLLAIDAAFQSGAAQARLGALPEVEDPRESRGVVARGWDRGVDNMQSTFYGFANALGEVTGIDALAQWGEDGIARNIWQAAANPATVETWEDIDGLADAGIYALEALVEFSPQLVADLAAGIGTGGVALMGRAGLAGLGKALLLNSGGPLAVTSARAVGKAGFRAGAIGSMYAQSTGETQTTLKTEGEDAPGTALLVGGAKAALDYAGLEVMLRSAFRGLGRDAITPTRVSELLGNSLRSVSIAAPAESLTEAVQTLMDDMAVMTENPDHEVNWSHVIDAALKGGIAGGGVAGAGSLAVDSVRMAAEGYRAGLDPLPTDAAPTDSNEPTPDLSTDQPAAEPAAHTAEEQPAGPTEAPVEAQPAEVEQTAQQAPLGERMAELARELQPATEPVEEVANPAPVDQAPAAPAAEPASNRWEGNGQLAERQNLEQLAREAVDAGIDLTRFQKTGLGQAVAERVRTGLAARVPGGSPRRLDSLEALAPVLEMEPAELRREYYDSRNQIRGREQLRQVFLGRVAEKFGTLDAFAKAIDALPLGQAEAIRESLGLQEQGGYDLGALLSEIQTRRAESGPRPERELDLDSPVEPTAQPAVAEHDAVREAVFNTPAIRQLLVTQDGTLGTGDQIDENLEQLGRGERLRLEETLKRMDIDIGGANRERFLQLLHDAVAERASYGIGQSRYTDSTGQESINTERTVEYDPSALDSDDVRLLELVAVTPLSDKTRSGWPAGLSLYLEAFSKIVKAGEPEQQSALDEQQARTLGYARGLGAMILAAVRTQEMLDPAPAMAEVLRRTGLDDALASRASGRELDASTALEAMARRTDHRAGTQLLRILSRQLDVDERDDDVLVEQVAGWLSENPTDAVAWLHDRLVEYSAGEPISDMGLLTLYEDSRDSEAEGPWVTREANPASARGRDAQYGEEAAVDPGMPLNEQVMSDDAFFGAVRRSSIQDWKFAVLPTAEQLSKIRFRDPLTEQLTQHLKGRNLLAIPEIDGSQYGRVIDAVALAMFAQGGERVPTTPAEAASNLMENLARLMAGPQSSHDQFNARSTGIVRRIPDDLVIFIDPATGRGVTFGQGLDHRRAQANAALRQARLQRQLDALTDEIGRTGEALFDFAGDLLDKTAEVRRKYPAAREAVERWIKMLAGEKDSRGNYFKKPTRKADPALRAAMDHIGSMTVGQTGQSLDALFGQYLSSLAERKKLANESMALSEDGARREAPTEEAVVARKLDVDPERDPGAARQVDEALRGGQRTAVIAGERDSIDSIAERDSALDEMEAEFDPSRADPLAGLNPESWMDAEDRAQEAAIRAWLEAGGNQQSTPPLFRLASTVAGQRPEQGMVVDAVRAIAERFAAAYKGNIPLMFRVEQTQESVYGPASLDHAVVKGAYHPVGRQQRDAADPATVQRQPGRLVLIADNLRDEADVLETLRHEILGHFGLNTFAPQDKRAVLNRIKASRQLRSLAPIWDDIARRYADMSEDVQAEEVFAYIAERERPALAALYDALLRMLAAAARRIGLLGEEQVTRAELAGMVERISRGIRDGHAHQRTFPQTDDAQFRRLLPGAGMLQARSKQFWSKGVVPRIAPVISMVHSRIARYNAELAQLLYQPANAEAAQGGRSWEQRSRALSGRMMAQFDRVIEPLRAGRNKRDGEAAVQAAFEDAYRDSPQTEAGQAVRRLVDNLVLEAERAGLRSVQLGAGFRPVAFDRRAVAARSADFQQLLIERAGMTREDAREVLTRIIDGPGVIEGAIAPGMPVGAHATTLSLIEAIGHDQLLNDGWLLRRHDAALIHWINGMSKRASWEAVFGGRTGDFYEGANGRLEQHFDPNGRFKELLDQVRGTHGEVAAQEVLALVNGALGRHPAGQSMPGWWRSTQEFITGWVGMTVLAFSGIASIPELALPLVRAGGRVGIGQMFEDLGQARRFARDMGIVLSDASEQVMWQTTGEQYQSPTISRLQRLFFRLNGNELIVRTSRTLATSLGIRYLLNAAADGDHAALQRLGLDAGTVHAWDQAGRPTWSPDQSPELQALSASVTDAVNQFVNEATLNPSRFQATHWGNNPYLKMIWHLKHFLYTYGDTVLMGIWRETRRRWSHLEPAQFAQALAIAAPALIFGIAVLPMAAGALELRDWLRQLNGRRGTEYEDTVSYLSDVFSRAGGLGPLEFLMNMRQQQEWGMSPFGSVAPVLGKVDMLFSQRPVEEKLRQLTPIWSQNKTLFGLLE